MRKFLNKILDWWTLRSLNKEFDKEVEQNVNMHYHSDSVGEIQEDQDVQQKYYNGVTLMKRRISQRLGGDFSAFGTAFGGTDLLALAESESREKKQLAQGLSQVYVYQGQDVKNPQDEAKMIDKRIGHYNTLQNKTEERDLLRKIRIAYKAGDTNTHETLMKEWKNKYGKSRNS